MALRESSSATFHNCQFDDSVVPNSYESYGSSSDLTLGAYGGGSPTFTARPVALCFATLQTAQARGGRSTFLRTHAVSGKLFEAITIYYHLF